MQTSEKFYNSQLQAIENFYSTLQDAEPSDVTITDAIITWFTAGYAEKFREDYLSDETAFPQN